MLEVKGLQKRYGRKKHVLRDVTFSVGLNEVTCLIGLNGEGKSTILKAILGLIPVDAGTVTTIGQALAYMADHYPDWNQETAERLLQTFQLFTTDKMANLSKGNKAKFNLVLGFALDRPYILLDEPLAGIDLFMKEQIAWIFSSEFMEGRSILMTTHEIAEVEQVIDRVLFLRDGKIVEVKETDELRGSHHQSVQDRMREVYQG